MAEEEFHTDGENFEERQVVVFTIGNEEFGVAIDSVREIIKISEITAIPNADKYIKGVINLRGKIVVVINLALKLELQQKEFDKDSRIVVIETEDSTIGLIVDSATEVLRVGQNHIQEASETIINKIGADYLSGVAILDERLIVLLELQKVLSAKELAHVKDIHKEHSANA